MNGIVIKTEGLVKKFKNIVALDNVTLQIQ